MYCANCGSELNDAKFCPTCGTAAGTTTTLPIAPALNELTANGRKVVIDPVMQVPLAGWWRRVGATIIDIIVLVVISLIADRVTSGSASIIISSVLGLTYVVALTSSASGQTLGNRAVRTHVRDAKTGERVSLARAILRWAVYSVPGTAASIPALPKLNEFRTYMVNHPKVTNIANMPLYIQHDYKVAMYLLGPVALYALVNYLSPLWDRRNRTFHDLAAGTVVTLDL